ncbi:MULTISPECIES: hypothetical protein [Streptomycetaceae]|uniref:hypothetical protein n=1 Tax=Streptomycetaceae TaxID=2062 RepID=UPI00300BF264
MSTVTLHTADVWRVQYTRAGITHGDKPADLCHAVLWSVSTAQDGAAEVVGGICFGSEYTYEGPGIAFRGRQEGDTIAVSAHGISAEPESGHMTAQPITHVRLIGTDPISTYVPRDPAYNSCEIMAAGARKRTDPQDPTYHGWIWTAEGASPSV